MEKMKSAHIYDNFECMYIPQGTVLDDSIMPNNGQQEMRFVFPPRNREKSFCLEAKSPILVPLIYVGTGMKSRTRKNLLQLFRFIFPSSVDKGITPESLHKSDILRLLLLAKMNSKGIPGYILVNEKTKEKELVLWFLNFNRRDVVGIISPDTEMRLPIDGIVEIKRFKIGEQLPGFRSAEEGSGICCGTAGAAPGESGRSENGNMFDDDPF